MDTDTHRWKACQAPSYGYPLRDERHYNLCLSVFICGSKCLAPVFWPGHFSLGVGVKALRRVDAEADEELQKSAVESARKLCQKTGINLAGFDFLFSSESEERTPMFLEINYFFGRRGLGGSEKFYELLNHEIKKWLNSLGYWCGCSSSHLPRNEKIVDGITGLTWFCK